MQHFQYKREMLKKREGRLYVKNFRWKGMLNLIGGGVVWSSIDFIPDCIRVKLCPPLTPPPSIFISLLNPSTGGEGGLTYHNLFYNFQPPSFNNHSWIWWDNSIQKFQKSKKSFFEQSKFNKKSYISQSSLLRN